MSNSSLQEWVDWFRNSSPYINAHKGKTFVLAFGGEVVESDGFSGIVHDIALLATLGVRMVLVHGSRPQVESRLRDNDSNVVLGRRVTDVHALGLAVEASGAVRTRIEALLSMGVANSPMHGSRIRVVSGNFVTAQPLGIHEGVDYLHTGKIRRVDRKGINAQLEAGNIVVISPIGYSPTGEVFNLLREDVALEVSSALQADKLIQLEDSLIEKSGDTVRELSLADAEALLEAQPVPALRAAVGACRAGVPRCHILDYQRDGELLQELFTRDGVGTLVAEGLYETIRQARIEDIPGLLELIEPLERDGTLVRRSRERLELEIESFAVAERDGAIIACAALYPQSETNSAELACVATRKDYRRNGWADRVLRYSENRARALGLESIFVLTTRTAHWFLERGFRPGEIDDLPNQRRELYNFQRNSRVFFKSL